MPFVKVDPKQEQREFEELLRNPEAKRVFDGFEQEYIFRQKLADARRANNIMQREIQNKTGMPQQAISRIEKGTAHKQSPTLRTLLRYVDAIGFELTLTQKQ